MRKLYGNIAIAATILVTGITWYFVIPSGQALAPDQFAQLFASLAILLFSWLFFISTRNRLVDTFFHGIDKAYVYHKYLAISAIVLIWVHKLTIGLPSFTGPGPVDEGAAESVGFRLNMQV